MEHLNSTKKNKLIHWLLFRSQSGPVSFLKHYSYKDIKRATDNFRRIIDNSSSGVVYRAHLKGGKIALVKEARGFNEEDDAFFREVQLLGRIHHRHIAVLGGFSTGRKRFLVFENIENGSLKEHLNDPLMTPLNWRTRLKIAIGVAAALEYLFYFCDPPVHHICITSSTVMLDENFAPKLSDVGIFGSAGTAHSSCPKDCTSQQCGNIIFQLGVLILELITGQSSGEEGGVDLIEWVQESSFQDTIHNMIDPDLGNNYDSRELKGLLAVARLCVKSSDKPTIFVSQIFWYLQKKLSITDELN